MTRCGEAGHVRADLGKDHCGGCRAQSRDLVEAGDHASEWGLFLTELDFDRRDPGVEIVDVAEHLGEQDAWWSVNRPVNASRNCGILARSGVRAISASTSGSRWPSMSACMKARAETPKGSHATTDSLIPASSRSFSTRFFSRAVLDQVHPVARQTPQAAADRFRWDEAGPDPLALGDLAQPDRVQGVRPRATRQVLDLMRIDASLVERGNLK